MNNIKELKDKYNKIISKCKSAEFIESDIEKPFKNIVEVLNKDIDFNYRMYFEDIILKNVKLVVECNEKGGSCRHFCENKKCFDDLKKFVENSNLKNVYDEITKKCIDIIKCEPSSFPNYFRNL